MIVPPKRALAFLRWFCREDYLEEIEGDLTEVFIKNFEKNPRYARWKFGWTVLKYFRPEFIKSFKNAHQPHFGMYKSHFKIGWRNLVKNTGYSTINISGLALGMIVVMLIGLWVHDELTFDRYHKNYERLAQVVTHVSIDGETVTYHSLPMPVAEELRTNYKDDFTAVAATLARDRIISHGDKVLTKGGCYSDYAFPEMASLEMLKGDHRSFKDRSHVLLSESCAAAIFGDVNPLDKQIRIGNSDLSVVGIYEDLPRNSSFYGFNFIAPSELLFADASSMNNWRSSSFQIYALRNTNTTFAQATAKIKNVIFNHTQEATRPQLHLNPMERWRLYEFRNGQSVPARLELVYIVGTVGFFILVLACINFVNLTTARSARRAREIGVRKSLGSKKSQLVNQFLCESFLVSIFALVFAIGAAALLLPWFNGFSNKQLEIPLSNVAFWIAVITSTVVISLAAGAYPAFYLSSIKPVKVLKGQIHEGHGSATPRRILVIAQFSISVILIVSTLVVFNQIQFVKNRPAGYSMEGLIYIPFMTVEINQRYQMLRQELLKTRAVQEVSQSSSPTTGIFSSADNLSWEGKDPARQLLFGTILIDPYFDDVTSWKMKDGRNFSEEIASDTMAFIFNESAIRQMGLTDPVGKTVRWHDQDWHIIGVVHDMVMTSPFGDAMPTVFLMNDRERSFGLMNIRLSSDQSTAASLIEIEKVFKKVVPNTPFDYKFANQEYASKFSAEETVGRLGSTFTVIAIFISCLGLLGLASFVAEQRTKEIGIRKVLGATLTQIWQLISYEFVILTIIACGLAVPLSWYLMSNWLQQYDYRMELSWYLFGAAAGAAIVITLITVSYHAIGAALTNPVKSLRSE